MVVSCPPSFSLLTFYVQSAKKVDAPKSDEKKKTEAAPVSDEKKDEGLKKRAGK